MNNNHMIAIQTGQLSLFSDELFSARISSSYVRRNDPMFLRNQFSGCNKYGIPQVKKQAVNLLDLRLIACTNTVKDDFEYKDCGVHFFVDDFRFEDIYQHPEKTYEKYSKYRFCLTPDNSMYLEMDLWRQLESVARSRWVGAWWQSKGMTVIPTMNWGLYPSYEFCFLGVETGSIVAISTYASHSSVKTFIHGYNAMLEAVKPEAIICYGKPFPNMSGNLYPVEVTHPRTFHRACH